MFKRNKKEKKEDLPNAQPAKSDETVVDDGSSQVLADANSENDYQVNDVKTLDTSNKIEESIGESVEVNQTVDDSITHVDTTTPDKNYIVEFKKVSKTFEDGTVGLDDVTFSLKPGEFVFLVGESGAGKTTLMKHIVREDIPTNGVIFVDGEDIAKMKKKDIPKLRRKVGFIYQDFKLLERKTAFENVALSLQVVGKDDEVINKVVPNLLHLVGLGDKQDKFPHHLSGGEKQRLAIARALAHEPKILLADEPTGNLDSVASWVVVDLIKKINEWGTTIIFGTHDAEIVNTLKKRVIRLHKGKVVSDQEGGSYE